MKMTTSKGTSTSKLITERTSDPYSEPFRWSDEEDQSYKIRRSATKLLSSIIATRPELLITLYKEVSPILISRFGDREETVRLEVWATYVTFLTQTRLYGGGQQAKDSVGVKRKRTPDGSDPEETAYTLLQSQVPALAKALLNQLKSPRTSPATLQAGFGLLYTLLQVLPGSLSSQAGLIASISKTILSQPPSTSSSTLHISCLQFNSSFFSTHPPPTFLNSLPVLTPVLLKTLGEKHPRVASEAFKAFSSLLGALKPVRGQDWVESVYEGAITRLANHATDAEVRSCSEDIVGDLWLYAPDTVHAKGGQEWEYVCRTSGRTDGAVKVVTRVAREADVSEKWVDGCVEWATKLLTKSGRTGKAEVFECLTVLLSRSVSSISVASVGITHSSLSADMTTACRPTYYALLSLHLNHMSRLQIFHSSHKRCHFSRCFCNFRPSLRSRRSSAKCWRTFIASLTPPSLPVPRLTLCWHFSGHWSRQTSK
jgi:cullin-associated NEDD8-dissociated protein 1